MLNSKLQPSFGYNDSCTCIKPIKPWLTARALYLTYSMCFVRREINEQNRREMLISLTEKGERTIEQVRKQSIHFFQNVLQHMTKDDQQLFREGLNKFTAALLKNQVKFGW